MNRRPTLRSHRRRSPGQALVEFALVAPIFFLVLFAIVEAGRFVFYYEVLHNATREGARYAIVHGENSFDPTGPPNDPSGADVIASVKRAAFGVLGSGVSVTPTWNTTNERGMTVSVRASYTYSTLIPLVPLPQLTVQAESSLVINN
jgi:Flp pilus assembly protein TadG